MQLRVLAVTLSLLSSAFADWQPLWPGEAPGAPRPAAGSENGGKDGTRLTDIEVPQYELHLAPEGKRTGQAMIVFPGGGYSVLAVSHEGEEIAAWLNERGITALIVKYRVSSKDSFHYQFPVPFLDARRAIRTARAHAQEWGIDPHKVGVIGFSAGGHLASLCATRFGDSFPEEGKDGIDQQDCRPDFVGLIYPVISMGDELAHGGSKRRLLGEAPTGDLVEKCSTEKHVTEKTPPIFLLSTADDRVDCRNSLSFTSACKAANVPVSMHLFQEGGHGYGLHGKGELAVWPSLFEAWLKAR